MHKTFISYHHANDQDLKDNLIEEFGGQDFIDKSIHDGDIDPNNSEEIIMKKIREDYLADSTVTLVLVGRESAQRPFVNSEIQASLWGSNSNGVLAVVRDEVYDLIYQASTCTSSHCNCGANLRTKTSQFTYYIPDLVRRNNEFDGVVAHYNDDQVYCSIIEYSLFIKDPEKFINEAFDKRDGDFEIKKKLLPTTPKI